MKIFKFYLLTGLLAFSMLTGILFAFRRDINEKEIPKLIENEWEDAEKTPATIELSGELSVSDNAVKNQITVKCYGEVSPKGWECEYDPVYGLLKIYCYSVEVSSSEDVDYFLANIQVLFDREKTEYCKYFSADGFMSIALKLNCPLYIEAAKADISEDFNIVTKDYESLTGTRMVLDLTLTGEENVSWDEEKVLSSIAGQYCSLTEEEALQVLVIPPRKEDEDYIDDKLAFINEISADYYIQLMISDEKADNRQTLSYYNENYFIPGFGSLEWADLIERNVVSRVGGEAGGIYDSPEGGMTSFLNIPACTLKLGTVTGESGEININEKQYAQYAAQALAEATLEALLQ